MDFDPPLPQYRTSDQNSFAYSSFRERLPAIITGAIEDVLRTITNLPRGTPERIEGEQIILSLSALKSELQHNKALTPLPDDGYDDIALYNNELRQQGNLVWHDAPWLFGECYAYRRMSTIFSLSGTWKDYDVFAKQKLNTFKSSRPAVLELAERYKSIIEQTIRSKENATGETGELHSPEAEKLLFIEMAEICLWGNATDLSLLTSLNYEDIQLLQGREARRKNEKNVLVNDLYRVFEVLDRAKKDMKQKRRVDFVLDNAGFELFVDLILAGYLLTVGLATEVILHPKSMPWFVSDVCPKDFDQLMHAIRDPESFYEEGNHNKEKVASLSEEEKSSITFLSKHWSDLYGNGKLVLRPNRLWTQGGCYWRLPRMAPELFNDLKESELVVFKGDLNYRKLTADVR